MAGEELKNRRYVEYKTFLINEYTHLAEFYTFPPFLSPWTFFLTPAEFVEMEERHKILYFTIKNVQYTA